MYLQKIFCTLHNNVNIFKQITVYNIYYDNANTTAHLSDIFTQHRLTNVDSCLVQCIILVY